MKKAKSTFTEISEVVLGLIIAAWFLTVSITTGYAIWKFNQPDPQPHADAEHVVVYKCDAKGQNCSVYQDYRSGGGVPWTGGHQ